MSNPRGFTLFELMLAAALSAMLMVGILAAVTSLYRPIPGVDLGPSRGANIANDDLDPVDRNVSRQSIDPRDIESLVFLLRQDIQQARSIETDAAGAITLSGYGSLDSATLDRSARPVRVGYAVRTIDDRHCLIRTQSALDDRTNHSVRRDLVLIGVGRIELTREIGSESGEADVDEPAPPTPEPTAAQDAVGNEKPAPTAAPPAEPRIDLPRNGDSYFYQGNWYYAQHLPAEAIGSQPPRHDHALAATEEYASESPTADSTSDSSDPFAALDSPAPPYAPKPPDLWRLRLWTVDPTDTEQPTLDRIIALTPARRK
jgi:prepilin-type N-terminal cleavage/methylation domain-containing protein